MKLIVGLGNPGKDYVQTRHNIGFIVIDKLLSMLNLDIKVDQKLESAYVKVNLQNEPVIFAKPLTFMNLSGQAVIKLAHFYKVDIQDILIISDDIALPLGKIRLREAGSHGGQNGLKNIIALMGSDQIKRLRIGIGKNTLINTADYVLGKLSKTEITALIPVIDVCANAIVEWITTNNFSQVMTKYNTPQTT